MCQYAEGYRHFPSSGKERMLEARIQYTQFQPHIHLTLRFGRTLLSWVTYRFPAMLCSRISFRLSVRQVVSHVIVRDSA